jgi:tetratricopeptide (TPR) repeat protein
LVYALLELIEIGNKPERDVPFEEQYPTPNPRFFANRAVAAVLVIAAALVGIRFFGEHFRADVHHNMAIFFSKEGIWTKLPAFESRVMSMPPDIREKYQETGGALQHYEAVNKKNHAFPMAHYFTGNVYNDWGSQVNSESLNVRGKGDTAEAQRLREKAQKMWDDAEKAYEGTKRLAPNYVQTHHQMGLLNMKRAEQAMQWGDMEKAKALYAESLKNFRLYHQLDPVFPPNYDRMVQILLMDNKYEEAEELYKKALYYNDDVAKSIHKGGFPDRVTAIATSLAKLYFQHARTLANNPFNPLLPQVKEALAYFKLAVEADPKNVEALKGVGFLLNNSGRTQEGQAALQKAKALAPNDPDLQTVPPPR